MINFLKYTKAYAFISALVIAVGIFSIVRFGYTFSIDFKGGSVIEYKIDKDLRTVQLKKLFEEKKIRVLSINKLSGKYLIKASPVDQTKEKIIREEIKSQHKAKTKILRFETVGPAIGKETIRKTVIASLIAVVGILLYMTFAFKRVKHGIAAVLAMLHDFLVLVGIYSLLSHFFGAEVDTLFVTAILTTMSFSVHDTIVVFDKIREYQRTEALPVNTLANKALTETMVRSINNSLTIALMLIPLTFAGGETIRFFAAALLIGTITGTYSSPFVATPILAFLERK